ncbi:MAG: hypothetical protein OXT07_10880 [bacterium]|nr:hypothetical protein [bacterium]
MTCHLYDHELTNGNTATTLVITCNDNYDCDLDIDNRENTAEFTPTYTDDDPYTQATITPRRAPNPVRTVSVSHRTITVDGEPYDAQYINGRVNTYLTHVYEPTTISYRASDGTTAYIEYTKSDGTTTTKVCTFINKVDPDTGDIISRFTEPVFPDADGLCRDETPVDESISVLGAFSTTPGREYDFKSAEGKDEDGNPYVRGSLREVTSPAPPDPVPIPGCFDTEERTVRSHPRGPSETVTAITGYSRCSEAEYYRYLDAAEQQTVDQYEAEERYVEEIAELDRQDRPFWICISREEWEEMNGVGPRCQLANPPGHQTFS